MLMCRRLGSTVDLYFPYLEKVTRFTSSDNFCLTLNRHSNETFTSDRFPSVKYLEMTTLFVDFKLSCTSLKCRRSEPEFVNV